MESSLSKTVVAVDAVAEVAAAGMEEEGEAGEEGKWKEVKQVAASAVVRVNFWYAIWLYFWTSGTSARQ